MGKARTAAWMYNYSKETPSDTSVSGWQIQALKAAHLTGLDIEGATESMHKAMDNLMRVKRTEKWISAIALLKT
jgi:hypothetical protein